MNVNGWKSLQSTCEDRKTYVFLYTLHMENHYDYFTNKGHEFCGKWGHVPCPHFYFQLECALLVKYVLVKMLRGR